MANRRKPVFAILLLASVMMATNTATALRLEIQPARFTENTKGFVNITCNLDKNDADTQTLFTLGISKDGGKPLVYMQMAGITYGDSASNTEKYRAEGLIHQDVAKSSLKLSILQPSETDQGVYECKMVYLDKDGLPQERQAVSDFTVEIFDLHKVVKTLMDEISLLKQQRVGQTSKVADMTKSMKSFLDVSENLKTKTAMLEKENGALNSLVKGLEEDVLILRQDLSKLNDTCHDTHESTISPKVDLTGYTFNPMVPPCLPGQNQKDCWVHPCLLEQNQKDCWGIAYEKDHGIPPKENSN